LIIFTHGFIYTILITTIEIRKFQLILQTFCEDYIYEQDVYYSNTY